jgi:hypothetical protein
MAALGVIATVASAAVGAVGAIAQGEAAANQAEYEAEVREKKANLEQAMGQRRMLERRRQGELQKSRLRAVAAKGGGDTADPTVMRLGEGIDLRSRVGAVTDYQTGAMRADFQRDAAGAARYRASNARTSGMLGAMGSVIGGFGRIGGSIAGSGSSFSGPSYAKPAPIPYYKRKNDYLWR